ncbi:leucine-rich PPR motif-containing protein, mitochondrial [Lates japonicus]|uniref:Leucine-rich PPR motif-containing protein, mitochondrial n=1 Tax=Lates japonicus TaxID=270547 RepID=A0AAD3MBE7_LATJO|nr:leucine-rich PPR motif-containing protein, mitochondrial [Lates japonicus]
MKKKWRKWVSDQFTQPNSVKFVSVMRPFLSLVAACFRLPDSPSKSLLQGHWRRCNALAEQKEVLVSYMSEKAQQPGQVDKIKALFSLIPDFTEKEVLYSYLMKCHFMDEDLASAKVLHEQMQKEGIDIDELSLKRLAKLYCDAGETVPFTEPPESFRFYADRLRNRSAKAQMTAEE